MVPKPDRDRIKALLTEAITVLCKNGLSYEYTCGIQGLLGLTLDDQDVFLVDLRESIIKKERPVEESIGEEASDLEKTLSELPEPEPHTQPSSPRSGASRRKRRRQSGQSSPTKRTAYSEDVDPGDEVIVIKEELFDTGACQGYGDIGEGGEMHQQDSNSSYPIASSGDYAGGECSQWGTASPSSSSHSAWPSLTQQQQQQQDMYPMPSSSFTPPTQQMQQLQEQQQSYQQCAVRFGRPIGHLKSPDIRNIFSEHMLKPFLSGDKRAVAVRISWFNQSQQFLDRVYDQLLTLRSRLDEHMKNMPGSLMHISALTATRSGSKKDGSDMKIYPGVSYFILVENSMFNQRDICNYIQAQQLGVTMKLLLQPYQQTHGDLEKVMSIVLKDTTEGCVPRMVEHSAKSLYSGNPPPAVSTITHAYGYNQEYTQALVHLQTKLAPFNFPMEVEWPSQ